jgi:hypothetical protein
MVSIIDHPFLGWKLNMYWTTHKWGVLAVLSSKPPRFFTDGVLLEIKIAAGSRRAQQSKGIYIM